MFMNSRYVLGERFERRYYHEDKDHVEIYPFEYDRKLKKWLPYGPGQSKISKEQFERLKKVRPILEVTRDDDTGVDFRNTMTDEIIACRAFSGDNWLCAKGKSGYGKGLKITTDELKTKHEAINHVLRGGV
jgi:hypothetical protein